MPVYPIYRDFLAFLDLLATWRGDPWTLYCEHYLQPHEAFVRAWWHQCMDLPEEAWPERVRQIKPEHYGLVRELVATTDLAAVVQETLAICRPPLTMEHGPTLYLAIGFFSPEGYVVSVDGEWCIGVGLERGPKLTQLPVIIAHEYGHWLRRQSGFSGPQSLGEAIVEEGLAVSFTRAALPDRPLADHLFSTPGRLRTLETYEDSLWQAVLPHLEAKDRQSFQKMLYGPPGWRDHPPRPGSYLGYRVVADFAQRYAVSLEELLRTPASEFLAKILERAEKSKTQKSSG